MKKTILIPTDFSIESLKMMKAILSQSSTEYRYEIIFLHGIQLSDSITDYLFYSKPKLIRSLTNTWFEEASVLLKNKFSTLIHSIRKDVFTGSSQSTFNSYLQVNTVDEIFIPASYSFQEINDQSFDLIPFIKKSSVNVNEIEWEVKHTSERDKLTEIFFS